MSGVIASASRSVVRTPRLAACSLVADHDLSRRDLDLILDFAGRIKRSPAAFRRALEGRQLALIFEKPSLRTRVTFEVGMTSMGGHAVYLEYTRPRLGEREPIRDVARNLERWVHGIAARTFAQSAIEELARHASIPVINALSDVFHPCQALADFLTLRERFGRLKGLQLAFVGDGNNVCHSLMITGARLGVTPRVATPSGFGPRPDVVIAAERAARETGASVWVGHDPAEAVAGAHAVYTDAWTSMGQEDQAETRRAAFANWRVTESLLELADPCAVFMHCLPAHRDEEVAPGVIDGARSAVYDQAENRLHAQKALLLLLLGFC